MATFDVIAIPTKLADMVRSTMKAPGYGHPVHEEVARGHGPCRHCLGTFAVGTDRRLLFTYDPFHELGDPALPGPIFVHAETCERYGEKAGYPEQLRTHAVTFQGYGVGRQLIAEEYVADGGVDPVIEGLLARAEVRYVHVRDTEAGCYDFRIERTRPV